MNNWLMRCMPAASAPSLTFRTTTSQARSAASCAYPPPIVPTAHDGELGGSPALLNHRETYVSPILKKEVDEVRHAFVVASRPAASRSLCSPASMPFLKPVRTACRASLERAYLRYAPARIRSVPR